MQSRRGLREDFDAHDCKTREVPGTVATEAPIATQRDGYALQVVKCDYDDLHAM